MAARMHVVKRNGELEAVDIGKIQKRLDALRDERKLDQVETVPLAQMVVRGLRDRITTTELDSLAAETAAPRVMEHPDYGKMAAAIEVSSLHKETLDSFSKNVAVMAVYVHPVTGKPAPLISAEVAAIVAANAAKLDEAIDYNKDYDFSYFGFMVFKKSYLLKMNGKTVERPQQLFMRVAVGIYKTDIEGAITMYTDLADKWYIHATPTLFNSGTPRPQMSSCFLLTMAADSIDGIYDTLSNCAKISKYAGGIGISTHKIRAQGSYIAGTNGVSNGLVPMLQVFNNTARYVDQGGGKRKGSFAIYLEPWHADVEVWLDLRKTHGKAEQRALDLFYALWTPDLFMKRVQENGNWSLFCPHEAPGLADVWGPEFEALYAKYEAVEGLARKTMSARDLWDHIKSVKRETGTPYIMFKDTCNRLSNQQNLGTIRSSNLCCEIVEYSAPDEIAVCNLASLNLRKFVVQTADSTVYDFEALIDKTRRVTRNLNHVIDVNFYPLPEAERSNMRHRPIGIGVQALADTFAIMGLAWEDEGARILNRQIFAAIYYGAMSESVALAKELFFKNKAEFVKTGDGDWFEPGHYSSFPGSPTSEGKFHFDLAGVAPLVGSFNHKCPVFDWETLRQDMVMYGMRNSLLVAPMPTASTSQIMGNNECFEPFTTNMYSRRVLAGEFTVVNEHMVQTLTKLGMWTDKIRMEIIAAEGSVQNIVGLPSDVKRLYKTVWEIPQKIIVQMAADRQPYVDQAQSMNIHMANPTLKQLDSVHFYAWKHGCKCGSYYLRTRPKVNPIQVTVDHEVVMAAKMRENQSMLASTMNGSDCLMCGS